MKIKILIAIAIVFAGLRAYSALPKTWEVSGESGIKIQATQVPPKNWQDEFPTDLIVTPGLAPGKKEFLPWDPTGRNNYPATPECQPEIIREKIWKHKSSVKAQASAVNEWLHECSDQISDPLRKWSYLALLKYARTNYRSEENSDIYYMTVTLPDGRLLTGFAAIKQGDTPRPLVIAKCGVLCNAEQSATLRAYMMHLYDESPFHVLALSNITGSKFQMDNGVLAAGGFDEGRQIYQIAKLTRHPDSPLLNTISSVHVVGASLGGNSALFSGLYASENDPAGKSSIQSVAAVCPVVVLENAVHRLYFSRGVSPLIAAKTLRSIKDIFYFVPVLGDLFTYGKKYLAPQKVYDQLSKAMAEYYIEWTSKKPWDLKPFQGVQVQSLKQFWQLNDFRNHLQDVKTPSLVIQAENDSIVRYKDNSELLAEALRKNPNENIEVVLFKQGNHCAFPVANGWANYSTLVREYILSHTPEASKYWQPVVRPLEKYSWKINGSDLIVETYWQAELNNPALILTLKMFNPLGKGHEESINECALDNPHRANAECYREVKMAIPMEDLQLEGFRTPKNMFEVTAFTRFANTRLRVLNENKKTLIHTHDEPRFVQFWKWD